MTGHYHNNTPNAQAFLAKTDSLGNVLWHYRYGDTSQGYRDPTVNKTHDGGYILSGRISDPPNNNWFLIKTDSAGNQEWEKVFNDPWWGWGGYSIVTRDTGYAVVGHIKPGSAMEFKAYMAKTDASGNTLWTKSYGTLPASSFRVLKQLSDGSFIAAGDKAIPVTSNDEGMFTWIVKLDEQGNVLWEREYSYYGGKTQNYVEDMTITPSGDIAITGYITATPPGHTTGNDMFILKVDSCGYLESDSIEANFSFSKDSTGTVGFTNQSAKYCTSYWRFGDGDSSNATNPQHSYTSTGTYTVHLIVRAGNSTDTITKQVSIEQCPHNPAVSASFQYQQDSTSAFTVHFTNQSQNHCHLQWHFGDGDTATATNPTHAYTDTGTYTITLIATAGIYADTFSRQITIDTGTVGVGRRRLAESSGQSDIRVYPNPASEVLHVESLKSNGQLSQIRIFDIQGRTLKSTSNEQHASKSTVNINNLPQGIYFYQVQLSSGDIARGKFVKR